MTPGTEEFGHGPGRRAFEAVWSLERYDALTRILAEAPVTWRFFVKHRIFAALKTPGSAADVYQAYATLRERFGELPPVAAPLARSVAAE
jgi:N-methylhydantoinase B